MFTCVIRYRVEPGKLAEFREYAQAWLGLIRRHGGTHHGYFVPASDPAGLPDPSFSFPGLGAAGSPDAAFALFSFPDVDAYDRYRAAVAQDDDCKAATVRFNETRCFSGYERWFLTPMFE
jgi:alkanesulfonate monooxygenase SsuD/methylene tetrahydromethanopterin reductase-like flavin-dependent oxidoreductase (luciferase family)